MKRFQVTYKITRMETIPVEYEISGEVEAHDDQQARAKIYDRGMTQIYSTEVINYGEPGEDLVYHGDDIYDLDIRELE